MRIEGKKIKKIGKIIYFSSIHILALIGFIFVGVFFAIRWGITDVSGTVDGLSERFQDRSEENQILGVTEETKIVDHNKLEDIETEIGKLAKKKELKIKILCSLNELSYTAPKNVEKILEVKKRDIPDLTIYQMIFAVETYLTDQDNYQKNINDCVNNFEAKDISEEKIEERVKNTNSQDIFVWVNGDKWQTVTDSVVKDQEVINMAAKAVEIDPRLIVSDLIVEQLRIYYSARELYEKYFEPLKILSNMNKISLGVMGIKEATAIEIENHLKDRNSPFYLGQEYENILDYGDDQNKNVQRYDRLTNNNHYYSYLYAGLYLKQMMTQWKNAGFDISTRPEVIGTLFNVGFPQSKPNANPKVGGSKIQIGETQYSFGRLSYEFYYSGELLTEFPYTKND